MRHFLTLVLLFAVGLSPAFAEPFLFEGFYLGMPRADAALVRPEIAWQAITPETASEAVRKEFNSSYLGREARVSIGLDRDGQFVGLIGFAFLSQSGSQCILDAVGARLRLERLYGAAMETGSEPLGRRAKWLLGDGVTVRWVEACAVGAGGYFVTYAKPAG